MFGHRPYNVPNPVLVFFLQKPCVKHGHVAHGLAPCEQRHPHHLRKRSSIYLSRLKM
jgi:hypothetical protein